MTKGDVTMKVMKQGMTKWDLDKPYMTKLDQKKWDVTKENLIQ